MNLLCRLGLHKRWREGAIDGERGPWQWLTEDRRMARCWRCDKPVWSIA